MMMERRILAFAAPTGLSGLLMAGVLGFPPLNEKTTWLKIEHVRGVLFHNPHMEPMFERLVRRPPTTPAMPALPVETVG